MNRFLVAFIATVALLTGCAKSSTNTVVNEDGSWTRTLKLTVSKTSENPKEPWPETFSLPKEGYTITSKTEKQDKIMNLVRNAKLGEGPLTDIVIKSDGETMYKNFVVVRRLDENRVEYYEKIIHTKAASSKNEAEVKAMANDLKANIPAKVGATDEEISKVANATFQNLIRLIVGPDDLLIGAFFTNPDGAERRIKVKIFRSIDQNMLKVFGERMTNEERAEVIRNIFKTLDSKKAISNPQSSGDAASSGGDSFIGMSTSVKLPGKILETNGEIDPFTGEVYWDYLSLASELGPLELRAICELKN